MLYSVVSCLWDFKGYDESTDKKFLLANPYPMLLILIWYLWFVLKFGPDFMRKRQPFHLGNILVVYNIVQVFISFYIFQLGVQTLYRIGLWNTRCASETEFLKCQYYYFLAKVIELLDTVFFVLRKKQRQVSFLHVYHHAMIVVVSWSITKYNKSDTTVFVGTLNCLVHVVMYGYYGLSVFPGLKKYLWWKKYITAFQLIQFFMVIFHSIISHMVSDCKPAHIVFLAVLSNALLFMYLFGDFYIKSYIKTMKNPRIVVDSHQDSQLCD